MAGVGPKRHRKKKVVVVVVVLLTFNKRVSWTSISEMYDRLEM